MRLLLIYPLLALAVHATHASPRSHLRRPLRRDLDILGVPLTSLLPAISINPPSTPTTTPTSTTNDTTTTTPTDTTTSTDGGLIPLLSSILNPPPTTTPADTTSPTDTTTPTTTNGGLVPLLSSILNPPPTTTNTDAPTSPTDTTSTTTDGGGLVPLLSSILNPPPATTTNPDTTPAPTDTTTTTTTDGGGLVPLLSSILNPPPPTTTNPDTTPAPTTTTTDGGGLVPLLSSILNPPPTTTTNPDTTPNPTNTTTGGGLIPLISSILNPSPSTTPTTTTNGGLVSSIVSSILNPPPSTTDGGSTVAPPLSTTTDGGLITTPPLSSTTDGEPVTSPPNISFPTIAPSSIPTAPPSSGVNATEPTPSTTISINSDFSFVLTESSLIFTSVGPTETPTLTNPDQATTTVPDNGPSPVTTLTAAPLPTGIPARIYPSKQLDLTQDFSGYTLISILFNQDLNWPFVVNNQVSSSQIFAYLPALITAAIGDPNVLTWVLQVYIPSSYQSPADALQLGTMWLGYIPTSLVDTLAAEIKAPQSAFYTGVPDDVARALALRVNSGFSLLSVADPNGGSSSGGSGSGGAGGTKGTSAKSAQARQDAIVGVVSALGGVALLVLAWLAYRSWQRNKELAHRRLSGSDDGEGREVVGARPEGREFDQDSVGGARRRSFYYAEDSLRGWEDERQRQQGGQISPGGSVSGSGLGGMVQRRVPVAGAPISAPVLGANTMNW